MIEERLDLSLRGLAAPLDRMVIPAASTADQLQVLRQQVPGPQAHLVGTAYDHRQFLAGIPGQNRNDPRFLLPQRSSAAILFYH